MIGLGHKSTLLTMVERKTLYTVIARLTGKRADLLAEAAINSMGHMKSKIHTVTLDNGLEFSEHKEMARGLQADIYFASPIAHGSVVKTKIPTVLFGSIFQKAQISPR